VKSKSFTERARRKSYCHWLHSRAIAATFSNATATATKRGIKMGSSENFCLRWNDFESNVSGAFRELRAESDFFDVTLTCDDTNANSRRPMQAHKVILSACSNLFKQMLRTQTGHPNPMIYLRGVRTCDLESVLDFMYQGEVNVAQDDLNSFLAVAEDLQIKGLTQNAGGGSGGGGGGGSSSSSGVKRGPGRPRKDPSAASSYTPAAKRKKPDPEAIKNEPDMDPGGGGADDPDFDAGEEGYGGAEAAADDGGYTAAAAGDDYAGDYGDVGLQADGGDVAAAAGTSGEQDSSKAINDALVPLGDSSRSAVRCTICSNVLATVGNGRLHVEAVHFPRAVVCLLCNNTISSTKKFRIHISKTHKISGERNILGKYGHFVK